MIGTQPECTPSCRVLRCPLPSWSLSPGAPEALKVLASRLELGDFKCQLTATFTVHNSHPVFWGHCPEKCGVESGNSDHALHEPGEESPEWEALQETWDELMLWTRVLVFTPILCIQLLKCDPDQSVLGCHVCPRTTGRGLQARGISHVWAPLGPQTSPLSCKNLLAWPESQPSEAMLWPLAGPVESVMGPVLPISAHAMDRVWRCWILLLWSFFFFFFFLLIP